MAQSIAKVALEIAKKREERKSKKLKEVFLEMVQKRFDENLEEMLEWTAIAGKGAYRLENDKGISKNDLHQIAYRLGFFVAVNSKVNFFDLAIPEYGEETELTPAQAMLKDFRTKFARKVGEQEEMAINFANDIFEKVKRGDFEYEKKGNEWSFKVESNLPLGKVVDINGYFTEKMEEIVKRAGFNDIEYEYSENSAILYFEEKTLEDGIKEN